MGIAISDAELLEASRRGEHAAFGSIVERYQNVVSAVSYSRTGDRALSEDVAQDTFLAAWRQLGQLRDATRLRSWLCGIARNLSAKARKRTAREVASDTVDEPAQGDPFDALSTAQSEHLVGDALGRVPEKYRDVLVLYYREQRSIAEVADMLGITEANATQRLARGRQHLADGVTSLVERSLRALPKASVVVGVLAALPLIASSRVEAHPASGGIKMFAKIALATALVGAAAGGTALVASKRSDAPATKSVLATAPTPTAARSKAAVRGGTMPSLPPRVAAAVPVLAQAPTISADKLVAAHITDGPSRGPADAPIVLTVFTDMKCSYCAASLGALDELMDTYPNAIRIVVKEMPVHESAKLAAEAAFAADAQGKFWEMHDAMMQHQDDLSEDALVAIGTEVGLDTAKLRVALDTHAYKPALDADVADAQSLEVTATPTFVVNGRRVVGLTPTDLRAAVEAALAD
ncbi:MAG TPA: sigma-70 family RNA polymerase sigma factor [Kofleriaceae bacterium]|jgi:RNA polymerase sigma factor (sigma-70 family)